MEKKESSDCATANHRSETSIFGMELQNNEFTRMRNACVFRDVN